MASPCDYLIHDFAGHPFQAELSRELARRGHRVVHAFCGGVTTGQGDLRPRPDDPGTLDFVDVWSAEFERYGFAGRLRSEVGYGIQLARLVAACRPTTVVAANTPLLSLAVLWMATVVFRCRRVFWLQDFLGRGARSILTERNRLVGPSVGWLFEALERRLLRSSSHIVAISPDFVTELGTSRVRTPVTVIENWAPLDEFAGGSEEPAGEGRSGPLTVLYAGTLGLKHDPAHLSVLAAALDPQEARVIVVTEGRGRDFLERARVEQDLTALTLRDFVEYDDLPSLLEGADVCVVLLEPDAGGYSVPSKVLTYLAAGRAIVAAVPRSNLAARTIESAGAGTVVRPGDHSAFCSAVISLCRDESTRHRMQLAARRYAERHFQIAAIVDRFETAVGPP